MSSSGRPIRTLLLRKIWGSTLVLLYQVTRVGLRDTQAAQILPFVANAFSIYLFSTFFLGLPRELQEAAVLDGARPWPI